MKNNTSNYWTTQEATCSPLPDKMAEKVTDNNTDMVAERREVERMIHQARVQQNKFIYKLIARAFKRLVLPCSKLWSRIFIRSTSQASSAM